MSLLLTIFVVAFQAPVRQRWWMLTRRSRWLVLAIVLTFALTTPGQAVWPGWPVTGEGLEASAEHGLRLVLILALVGWLLDANSRAQLMAGLYSLSLPLRACGWPTARAVARLALVFEYLEQPDGVRGWRELMAAPDVVPNNVVTIERQRFGRDDRLFCALAIVMLALSALS